MTLRSRHVLILAVVAGLAANLVAGNVASACTGITLKAKDGAVVYGRTMEWGAFDLQSRIWIIPPGREFTGTTPDGKPGLKWKVWCWNGDNRECAGQYLFEDESSVKAYLDGPIVAQVKQHPAISNLSAKVFEVMETPTAVTRGPV